MCRSNDKTQVSGNKCTEQDLFFYWILIEVSIEGLEKNHKQKKAYHLDGNSLSSKDRVQCIKPRAVTKIWSCKIYANYRWGFEQQGNSIGSACFPFVSYESNKGSYWYVVGHS